MKIFKIENHILVIDKDEIRLIPEFKELLVRDKGKGGNDRGSKTICYKEFKYIYFVADYKSPYVDYPDKEREKYSREDAGLENDWKVDSAIRLAIDKYKKLQETPSIRILNSLQRGLMLSSQVVDNVCNDIQYLLDESKSDLVNLQGSEETDPIKLKELKKAAILKQMEYSQALVSNLTTLQELGAKVPKTLLGIENLAERVRKETEGDNTVRGGGKKGNRADPKI